MSGLTEALRDRASRRGRTARVSCGALGTVTVEALSPADCAILARQGGRALLYAACRELQESGEALRRDGLLYRPDEIMSYVTEEEAAGAVRTVRALSGLEEAPEKREKSGTEFLEVRPDSVQRKWPEEENPSEGRLEIVQSFRKRIPEIRPVSVRSAFPSSPSSPSSPLALARIEPAEGENGQASCEFLAPLEESREEFGPLPEEQNLPEKEAAALQDIAVLSEILGPEEAAHETESESGPEAEETVHETESESGPEPEELAHETESESGPEPEELAHETESDSRPEMEELAHETESESGPEVEDAVHETESESGLEVEDAVHETESESGPEPEELTHEIKSESGPEPEELAHETKSESAPEVEEAVHETKSESGPEPEEAVHEIESESVETAEPLDAEAFAWALLEGLRRAAGAR